MQFSLKDIIQQALNDDYSSNTTNRYNKSRIIFGIKIVEDSVTWIEKERTLSEYIQDIVRYLLTFISFLCRIFILLYYFCSQLFTSLLI
jgi:hypothetical protein